MLQVKTIIPCRREELVQWQINNPSSPSFWRIPPNEIESTNHFDVAYDGCEMLISQSGELDEFGFIAELTLLGRRHILEWPTETQSVQIQFETRDLQTGTMNDYSDNNDDQRIQFDTETCIAKWTYDKNFEPDCYFSIATNVIIGLKNNTLLEILGKTKNLPN